MLDWLNTRNARSLLGSITDRRKRVLLTLGYQAGLTPSKLVQLGLTHENSRLSSEVARRLIREGTGTDPTEVIDVSRSKKNYILIARTTPQDLVVRIPIRKRHALFGYVWAYKQWDSAAIPVPRVLIFDNRYLIETRMQGTEMVDDRYAREDREWFVKELGAMVRRMHGVRTQGYGFIRRPGIGEKRSWRDYYEPFAQREVARVRRANLLPRELLDSVRQFFRRSGDVLLYDDPRLVHGDLKPANILTNNRTISGIIDPEYARSGDPMEEIAIIMCDHALDSGLMESFCDAYGKVEMKRVNYYTLVEELYRVGEVYRMRGRAAATHAANRVRQHLREAAGQGR